MMPSGAGAAITRIGRLAQVKSRLDNARTRLIEFATFDQVLEELTLARAELSSFDASQERDGREAIEALETIRKNLRFISLSARNLMELRSGLARCAGGDNPAYLPGNPIHAGTAGQYFNVEG